MTRKVSATHNDIRHATAPNPAVLTPSYFKTQRQGWLASVCTRATPRTGTAGLGPIVIDVTPTSFDSARAGLSSTLSVPVPFFAALQFPFPPLT